MGRQGPGLGRRVVGDPDGADEPVGDQPVERGSHLGRMGEHVGPVHLVEVDAVGPQPVQRGLARRPHRCRARVVGHWRHDAALGGQHHAIAQVGPGPQHGTQVLLAGPEAGAAPVQAVHVGDVHQIHAELEPGLDQRRVLADIGAGEAPQPQCQRADLDTARPEPPRARANQGRVAHSAQDFTEPASSPRTKKRCRKKNTSIGTPACTKAPADSRCSRRPNSPAIEAILMVAG